MKVLQLIYTTGLSGAEKYLIDIIPELKSHGINCDLICVGPQSKIDQLREYCAAAESKGIKTVLITSKHRIDYISIAKKINNYIKEYDIKFIHSHLFNADIIAVFVKRFFNRNIFLLSTKHGYSERYLIRYKNNLGKIPYDFYYFITKLCLKYIDLNITVSRSISDLYFKLKLTKNKMPFIHHGITITKSNGSIEQNITGDPKLLVVGRLEEIKGHSYLIAALPVIAEHFPAIKILFLGNGSLKAKLIQQATALGVISNIEFLGYKNPADISPMCKAMVIPSLYESFGLIYIEAFALKIPVIAFDAPAANEIIIDEENGFLAHGYNAEALAQKIIYVLKNPEKRETVIANAYNNYISYYNTDRMISEMVELYRSL